jgi:hypothetical protein
MKRLVLTVIAVVGISGSVFGQGTISADNLNGAGNATANAFGLFFDQTGAPYTGATLNVTILGGPDASSLSPVATFVGPTALVSGGGGVYLDPSGASFVVPGVGSQANATLRVLAWRGSSLTYAGAAFTDQFWVRQTIDPNTFTFINGTGGPTPPPTKLPQSLDGMPAMVLAVPEPSTLALAGLGAVGMLLFRRRK